MGDKKTGRTVAVPLKVKTARRYLEHLDVMAGNKKAGRSTQEEASWLFHDLQVRLSRCNGDSLLHLPLELLNGIKDVFKTFAEATKRRAA